MANFHDLEMSVIRHAEANKLLEQSPGTYVFFAASNIERLCDEIICGKPAEISDSMGRCVIDMIRLCAMLDIDLAKCLEQAFEKISAKPEAPSNVLQLKKD